MSLGEAGNRTLPPMSARAPVVVAVRRTPIGTAGRGLAHVDAAGLAAPVLSALADDVAELDGGVPARIGDVVLGNCCGPGGDVARVAVLAAGLGTGVPGVSVDRQCGSGLEAVRLGSALVASGDADVVLAGGVESASTMPWRLARPDGVTQAPTAYTRAPFTPAGWPDPEMGQAAEALATHCGVTRARQDAYAARSHARTVAARVCGRFDAEMVAVGGLTGDERPRAGLDVSTLARFRPAFRDGGSVTAGNSCGINDGAAAVAIVSEQWRARAGVPGLRLVASAAVGVDPELPGLGPVAAVRAVLERSGAGLQDVGVLEITEAFAAQVLACTDQLGLDAMGADADRVCPEGGAIALGHPWGASGAMLVLRLYSALVRGPGGARGRYGLATCAVGGGQGVAVLVERVG